MSNDKFQKLFHCWDTMWDYVPAFREYCKGIEGFLWFDSCYDKWLPSVENLESVLKEWAKDHIMYNDGYEFGVWLDCENDEEFYAWQRAYAKKWKLPFYKKEVKSNGRKAVRNH